jgi:hypothetical protein
LIVAALLALVFAVVGAVLSSFSVTVPTYDLGTGIASLAGQLHEADTYLPVTEALGFIVAGAAFDLVLTGAKFVLFLWSKVPIFGR